MRAGSGFPGTTAGTTTTSVGKARCSLRRSYGPHRGRVPGRARAGRVPKIAAQITRHDVGESRERFFQQHELIWPGAFLRSKGSRRATFSEKRIQHISRGRHVGKSEITRG